jgi:Zn-dependent peptidase ImmA (M78 family)
VTTVSHHGETLLAITKTKRIDLCITVAAQTLRSFEKHAGELHPPIPVEKLAAWLGYQVVDLFHVPDEFSALVSTQDKLIGINGNHHRHRRRFSLSHEIAHIVMKHPPEKRCTREEVALFNAEADLCAAALLIPEHFLRSRLEATVDIPRLAEVFDVSKEAMERRIRRLKGMESVRRIVK